MELANDCSKKRQQQQNPCEQGCNLVPYKKARFSWQIKGTRSVLQTTDTSLTSDDDEAKGRLGFNVQAEANFEETLGERNPDSVTADCIKTTNESKPSFALSDNQRSSGVFNIISALRTNHSDKLENFEVPHLDSDDSDIIEDVEAFTETENKAAMNADVNKIDLKAANCSAPKHTTKESLGEHLYDPVDVRKENSQNFENYRRGMRFSFEPPMNLNQSPPFISLSCQWQKHEVGCAIVDNVFNRTLEEMGISPDSKMNMLAKTRLAVENQSIEAAIRQQGLQVNDKYSESISNETDSSVLEGHDIITEIASGRMYKSSSESINNHEDIEMCDSDIAMFVPQEATHDQMNCDKEGTEVSITQDEKDRDILNCSKTLCQQQMNDKVPEKSNHCHVVSENDQTLPDLNGNSFLSKSCSMQVDGQERVFQDNTASIIRGKPQGIPADVKNAKKESDDIGYTMNFQDDIIRGREHDLVANSCGDESSLVLDLAVSTAILSQGLTMSESR